MNILLNQPLIWITVLGIILAVAAFLAAHATCGGKRIVLAIIGALLVLCPGYLLAAAFKPEWIDTRFRAYKSFYADLQIGMTRAEVLVVLEKHYPEGGPRQRPIVMRDTAAELGFFMNAEHSYEPNCEGIFLNLLNNRVTRVRYSED